MNQKRRMQMNETIREYFKLMGQTPPPHIESVARAVSYDLRHGPAYALIIGGDIERFNDDCYSPIYDDMRDEVVEDRGDIVCAVYGELLCNALREYIYGLPGVLYWDYEADYIYTHKDEYVYDDEAEEEILDELENYVECGTRDIVEALFGATIAREFL